jgi:O-antigen/teichoic acid export membrane protein
MAKSKEFWGAVVIIPILSLSIFFVNMKDVTIYGLHIAKKTKIVGTIVVISTVLGLVFNYIFIPMWGITGAAIATLLAQVIYWYACHYYSQKVFFIPYETGKLAVMLITGVVLSFSSLLLNDLSLVPRLLLKTAGVISFPFILYLFNFYEPAEIQAINGFFRKWSNIKEFWKNLNSLKGIKDEL